MPFVARVGPSARLDRGDHALGDLDAHIRSPAGLQERFLEEQDGHAGSLLSSISAGLGLLPPGVRIMSGSITAGHPNSRSDLGESFWATSLSDCCYYRLN